MAAKSYHPETLAAEKDKKKKKSDKTIRHSRREPGMPKYTMSVMYTSSSLSVNVHTILVSNPLTQCLYAADIIYEMSNRLVY